jgi:hypothetical protein
MNYALEGNLEADFQVNKNEVRTWYHTPGLAYGEGGREFARGLTRERSSRPFELAPTQGTTFQNWGVGFYNPAGGFTIGQVWQDRDNPDPSKAQFPEGTVSIKLLFTEATLEEVPFLEGSIEWEVNIWENLENPARSARKLRLLQVDLAVKDSRLNDSTGWAFGTLVYDNSIEANDPWQRLRPVGLMWGNDPGVTPEDILANRDVIRESWINPAAKVEHLGWAGRLNGPVDNPISSCLSCHSTALVGAQVSMVPSRSGTDQERLQWFRNLKGDESFSGEGTPTDYSLQLSMGIMNYLQSLKANEASTNGPQKK